MIEKKESLKKKVNAEVARKEYINVILDKIEFIVKNENIDPNDIMVLVQHREPFSSLLIRELKKRKIEVAGNDKINLPVFPAIKDLLNLIRFSIDNDDEYRLCCILKSPFYRFNEEKIYKLCYYRTEKNIKVFDSLKEIYPEIYSDLEEIIKKSKYMQPFSFFSYFLNKNENYNKMIEAMGNEVIDPIEEFLTISLTYQRSFPGTLRHFLKWFIEGTSEISRDVDANNGVKVITVHASKGLGAKVVFLIDTITIPKKDNLIYIKNKDQDLPLWLWAKGFKSSVYKEIEEESNFFKLEEYYRLLYVAMTRAKNRLYIYGFNINKELTKNSWFESVFNQVINMPNVEITEEKIRINNENSTK